MDRFYAKIFFSFGPQPAHTEIWSSIEKFLNAVDLLR